MLKLSPVSFLIFSLLSLPLCAQPFTMADTLRGSMGEGRLKWDVLKYDISIEPDYANRSLSGSNTITYFDSGVKKMQIDLQAPMQIDSIYRSGMPLNFFREGNVYWVLVRDTAAMYKIKPGIDSLTIYFSGKPIIATNAPWNGGWIFTKDKQGRPWMTVACQGLGASVWYPCKDTQADEPDSGAVVRITVPEDLVGVANGRLVNSYKIGAKAHFTWKVVNPINNYNIVPYIGHYVHFSEEYQGLKGKLDMDFRVLDYNEEKARQQFKDAARMMKAFEHWFGPYPFYEDCYKLVESSHLGMEHQSNIAYGNHFQNGYKGTDLSQSGWGLKWDFIIVHESGHEWFGNNITTKDIADMWVHEGFTHYSETLFTEYYYGKEAGTAYIKGVRENIENDKPIVGPYGVNRSGSGDMYYKAGNMIHLIRQLMNDDEKFRTMLIEMNKTFYHKTVTGNEVQDFMKTFTGIDLEPIFRQYLYTTKVPVIVYRVKGKRMYYHLEDVVDGFTIPIKIIGLKNETVVADKTERKARLRSKNTVPAIDDNYYILIKKLD